MANAIVTLKIMPVSPETDLKKVEQDAMKEIISFNHDKETKTEIEPIAFGLSALKIIFVMDEKIGSTEGLEHKISKINGVESVEVTDVRRAIG